VTQQNAALVEESAAAAESLKHQAAALANVVSVFKLSHESGTAGSAHGRAVAAKAPVAERRSPERAPNSLRPSLKPNPVAKSAEVPAAAAKTGAESWETF
jgi:methyl-accepting chemotaxis protein